MNFLKKHAAAVRYAAASLIFIIGMVFATMYDFKISAALTRLTEDPISITVSVFSLVMEFIGEWPSVILGAFCACIITRALVNTDKTKTKLAAIPFVIIVFALMFYGAMVSAKHLKKEASQYRIFICLLAAALLSVVIFFAVMRLSEETAGRLLVPAIICGAVLAVLFLGIQCIKEVVGRVRMRELVAMGDLSLFSPWYKPNFFSGSHSFPSGHTANAVILSLLPIFYSEKTYMRYPHADKITYAAVAVWSITMAITRINAGAHFLSDVLFGAALAYIASEVGHYVWKRVNEE
ncbi:MAG: phosphatase PAP2 family protein [Eubacteriales bacterium]